MTENFEIPEKDLIFMSPDDAAKIVKEMNELRTQVTETRCLVKAQANHIGKIKSTLATLSAQVQLMVPRTSVVSVKKGKKKGQREVEPLRLKYLPINNMEKFQALHLKVTRDKDTQFASKIYNELREISKEHGGVYGDLTKWLELIITREFCCEVNWSGVLDKKPLCDNWLFKICLPKVMGIDPTDKLGMGVYAKKVKEAHQNVTRRYYAQVARKKTKEMLKAMQSTSTNQTQEETDPFSESSPKKSKLEHEDGDETSDSE